MASHGFPDFASLGSFRGRGGGQNGSPGDSRGGGRARGGGRGRGSTLRADYSAVRPIDYSVVNQERYKTVNGYTPSPYENGTQTSTKGAGRGGRNFTPSHATPTYRNSPNDSGTATPSQPSQNQAYQASFSNNKSSPSARGGGLGFGNLLRGGRGGGNVRQMMQDMAPRTFKTVGADKRKIVDFGAPVFVLGGTLFQDEKHQPDMPVEEILPVEMRHAPRDEPESRSSKESSPLLHDQIVDMDRVEVIISSQSEFNGAVESQTIDLAETLSAVHLESGSIPRSTHVQMTMDVFEDIPTPETETSLPITTGTSDGERSDTGPPDEDLFYIDVNPGPAGGDVDMEGQQNVLYTAASKEYLGEGDILSSDEEEIILVPRKFQNPIPISLPAEPHYAKPQFEEPPKQTLIEKFGGKSAGKDGRPVTTTSIPSKKSNANDPIVISDNESEAGPSKAQKSKASKNKKKAKREKRQKQRDERMKKTEGIIRHKMPRFDSDIEWGSEGAPKVDTLDAMETDEEDDAIPTTAALSQIRPDRAAALTGLSTKGLTGKKKREMEILMDYVQNTVDSEDDSDSGSAVKAKAKVIELDSNMDALKAFASGMDGRNQVMIDDIVTERQIQAEDDQTEGDWADTSGSELTDGEGESSGRKPARPVKIAPGLLGKVDDGLDDSIEIDEDELDSTSEDGAEMAGMGWAVPAPSSSSSDDSLDEDEDIGDDIDDIFKGKGKHSWAEAADDFIECMNDLVDDDDLVMGSGKKFAKNKLFRAIQNGDFGDDWPTEPSPKGKKNKLKGVPAQLQEQWEKDRQKKAEKKQQRELDRLEAAMSPYGSIRKQGKSKGKRKEIFPLDYNAGISAREIATLLDVSDGEDDGFGYKSRQRWNGRGGVTDLASLNEEIIVFLRDLGKTTMSLPPMDKFSRKQVHEMAACYGLKSQSKGKGNNRFPVLIRTSRSSREMMDYRTQKKLENILGTKFNSEFRKSKQSKSNDRKLPGSTARTGAGTIKHKDGDAVGHGASALGEDNIGHRLLSKMGWTEGARIGMSGGLDVPIVAIVKNTKLGLGA